MTSHPAIGEYISINPATEQEIERFGAHDRAEVNRRLNASRSAYREWSRLGSEQRLTPVKALPGVLRAHRDDFAARITAEMGKPITEATAEIDKCAASIEFLAGSAPSALADVPAPSDSERSFVAHRPLGTLLAIMPWNFPWWQVIRAAVPALCAGNTVILKHAPNVFGCAIDLENAFTEAGFPAGAFSNLFVEADVAQGLIADERIAAVTLTGSARAGAAVGAAAGAALKKSVLELGGSDAFIVLGDANIEEAAKVAVKSRFQNCGQSCIAAKRFIVEHTCTEQFTDAFLAEVAGLTVGDPASEDTTQGPMARDDLRALLERQLQQTTNDGARILAGGKRPDGPGWFFEPTVIDQVADDSPAATDETFGPLAPIITVADADEAIAVANRSRYGLGGNIWTADIKRGVALAARLESGGVFINGMTHSDARIPFGGIKNSGYGRELAGWGLREFTNVQTVWF